MGYNININQGLSHLVDTRLPSSRQVCSLTIYCIFRVSLICALVAHIGVILLIVFIGGFMKINVHSAAYKSVAPAVTPYRKRRRAARAMARLEGGLKPRPDTPVYRDESGAEINPAKAWENWGVNGR